MKFISTQQTSTINGKSVTFNKAQLTGLQKTNVRRTAERLCQGSTVSIAEFTAVCELIYENAPKMIAEGIKIDLGFALIVPTVSGSIKEEDWRTQRVEALLRQHPDWTRQQATTEQQKEKFTTSALTSKHLTASYALRKSDEFAHAVNDRVEWERTATGTPDPEASDDTTTPDTPTDNTAGGSGQGNVMD